MAFADLHVHSNHSDGIDSPRRVVERAVEAGIGALALTDHDTVSGVPEARHAAHAAGLLFLEGLEISSRFSRCEVHVIGLGVAVDHPALLERLETLQEARRGRVDRIVAQLAETGVHLDAARIRARVCGGVPGRMHVALELREMGITRGTQEGFDRFLNHGRAGYVPKEIPDTAEAVAWIHAAGGLAFVAHPGLSKSLRKRLPQLLELPFDGIEAYHISHSPGRTSEFVELAKERGILVSGGSDCHGGAKSTPEMGKVQTPLRYAQAILAALGRS